MSSVVLGFLCVSEPVGCALRGTVLVQLLVVPVVFGLYRGYDYCWFVVVVFISAAIVFHFGIFVFPWLAIGLVVSALVNASVII